MLIYAKTSTSCSICNFDISDIILQSDIVYASTTKIVQIMTLG